MHTTLQKLRESLTLVLLALLPFHALAVTFLTKVIAGPGHAPLQYLAMWKEVLLGIILLLALMEMYANIRGKDRAKKPQFDVLDFLFLAILNIAIIVSAAQRDPSLGKFLLGFKYDIIPLIAFIVLRKLPWSEQFFGRCRTLVITVGVIVAVVAIDFLFLRPGFFTWLGYSDLHSLYISNGPLAAFQHIGGTALRRAQSTFSGPNQLGLWLLLPWTLLFLGVMQGLKTKTPSHVSAGGKFLQLVTRRRMSTRTGWALDFIFFLLVSIALAFTFSRSAWVAAAVIAVFIILSRVRTFQARNARGIFSFAAIIILVLVLAFPTIFLRAGSSREHINRPLMAMKTMMAHPWGLGLGSAGPAAHKGSDLCVDLQPNEDPGWWKRNMRQACVFQNGVQIQPRTACNCPLIPENWYLQIGVEMGILGLIAYMVFLGLILKQLLLTTHYSLQPSSNTLSQAIALTFIGISIAALFLHAWEDAAVAYTGWVLLTVVFSQSHRTVL